jgi:hypothetical protein
LALYIPGNLGGCFAFVLIDQPLCILGSTRRVFALHIPQFAIIDYSPAWVVSAAVFPGQQGQPVSRFGVRKEILIDCVEH